MLFPDNKRFSGLERLGFRKVDRSQGMDQIWSLTDSCTNTDYRKIIINYKYLSLWTSNATLNQYLGIFTVTDNLLV